MKKLFKTILSFIIGVAKLCIWILFLLAVATKLTSVNVFFLDKSFPTLMLQTPVFPTNTQSALVTGENKVNLPEADITFLKTENISLDYSEQNAILIHYEVTAKENNVRPNDLLEKYLFITQDGNNPLEDKILSKKDSDDKKDLINKSVTFINKGDKVVVGKLVAKNSDSEIKVLIKENGITVYSTTP